MEKFIKPLIEVVELDDDQIITASSSEHHYGPDYDPDDDIIDW